MNTEMAYLLGMITGNGEIQRGATTTTISIDVPHKKLETEFQKDVGIYVKASITDSNFPQGFFHVTRNKYGISCN